MTGLPGAQPLAAACHSSWTRCCSRSRGRSAVVIQALASFRITDTTVLKVNAYIR